MAVKPHTCEDPNDVYFCKNPDCTWTGSAKNAVHNAYKDTMLTCPRCGCLVVNYKNV